MMKAATTASRIHFRWWKLSRIDLSISGLPFGRFEDVSKKRGSVIVPSSGLQTGPCHVSGESAPQKTTPGPSPATGRPHCRLLPSKLLCYKHFVDKWPQGRTPDRPRALIGI